MAFFRSLFKSDKDKKKEGATGRTPTDSPQPQPERLSRDDFEDIEILGKGSFAKVLLVRRKATDKYYAMKVIDKKTVLDHKRQRDAFIERDVMRRLPHPYLLRLHGTFQSEHKLFFVLDYMPGGDFDKYLNTIPNKAVDLDTARLYAAEIFLAIKFLHDNHVIYRDLKPENILMSREGHLVLADFGLSKIFAESADNMVAASFVGSPFYVAPDVLKQKPYNEAVDFWSFGILLYRMIYGRPPFSGRTMKDVFDSIVNKEVHFPTSYIVKNDEAARDLILRLLSKTANDRITAQQIQDHPFWTGLNWDDVLQMKVLPKNFAPLPTTEEHVRRIQQQQQQQQLGSASPPPAGAKPKTNPKDVMHTPAGNAAHLSQQQQQQFNQFSAA